MSKNNSLSEYVSNSSDHENDECDQDEDIKLLNNRIINFNKKTFKSLIGLGLRCSQHNTIALLPVKTLPGNKILYWLPYIENVSNRKSIFKQINSFLKQYLTSTFTTSKRSLHKLSSKGLLNNLHLLSWIKVSVFESVLPELEQRIYIADIVPECCVCDKKNNDFKWICLSQFDKNTKNSQDTMDKIYVLGIEVHKVVEAFQSDKSFKDLISYEEITETEITYLLQIEPYKEHLEKINYNLIRVMKLYQDFRNFTYPSLTLCEEIFREMLISINLKDEFNLERLFHSFSYVNGKYLLFSELLLGLSVIEPEACSIQIRIPIIFQYFCVGNEVKTKQMLKDEGKQNKSLDFIEFQSWIKSLKNEDSNRILKATKSPIYMLCCKDYFPKITNFNEFPNYPDSIQTNINSCCSSNKAYRLVPYSMNHDTKLFRKISNSENDSNHVSTYEDDVNIETFLPDIKKIAFQILEEIRLFRNETDEKKEKFSPNERFYNVVTVQNMLKIFENVKKLFLSESSLLKISPPCLIFGDIHGNLLDLLYFEKHFWPLSPSIHPFQTLFLGDYVDRGELSLEVVLYLFSLKILLPNKILMLRGNHELRHVQISYTFEKECLKKLGFVQGKLIWESVNKVFDVLPLAAVIGGRLFCSHGGIPVTDMSLQNISQIDKVLFSDKKSDKGSRIESQSPIGWQLLWNDPFEDERYFREYLGTCMWSTDVNYIPNIARGTAMYFLSNSIRQFIQNNQLSYVVRAHECPFYGTRLQFDNRLCTVFSCSNYCGKNNFSGMLLVDKPEIVNFDNDLSNFRVGVIHRFSINRPQVDPDWLKLAKAYESSQKDDL